jgi:hypothetical protein
MIREKCFTEGWLDVFKKQPAHRRIDKITLEKMIHALHLLERLKTNGLSFVLKGGTSLVLLLEEGSRFSIDIDIICKTDRKDLEAILNKVIQTSRFTDVELDDYRSYQPGVPKAHYGFLFDSVIHEQYSGKILLDVLIEDSVYPELIQKPIQTKWIETEFETNVSVPSIDSITGDKLTAFAPNTIGIPYFRAEQPFAMEICKQLFDLGKLFDRINDCGVVAKSFQAFAELEFEYRKDGNKDLDITPDKVLQDTVDTCLIITKRDMNKEEPAKSNFKQLQNGIRAFGTGYLMTGNFRIDDAVVAAARVAHLAAKILTNDLSPIQYFKGQDVKLLNIETPDWSFLNKLKRQPDKSSFYYWYHTVRLFTT